MRTYGVLLGALALASGATLAVAQPAGATTPPVTGQIAHPYIPVGTVGDWFEDCVGTGFSTAGAVMSYSASSPAGISRYDATFVPGNAEPTTYHYDTATPARWVAGNYNDECGGHDEGNWDITAYDNAGRSATASSLYYLQATRWDNTRSVGDLQPRPVPGSWRLSTGWRVSTCSCADGGTQTFTTTPGAYGVYSADVAQAGEHRDLMMAVGPGRGRADIYLDGKWKAVVNTDAPANGNRVYKWDSGALPEGRHAIKVVNRATSGHPRIDINAMSVFD